MEDPDQQRNLRRKIIRNTTLIFFGFFFIVLCFVFLGVAQQHKGATLSGRCEDNCHSPNDVKVFRLLAAIFFLFGFTTMVTFWWHIRAIRSSYLIQRQRLQLEMLLHNGEVSARERRSPRVPDRLLRNTG